MASRKREVIFLFPTFPADAKSSANPASTQDNAFMCAEKLYRRLQPAVYWIVGAAFVLRLAARLLQGADSFWANGYTLFFAFARSLAAGKGFAFANGDPETFRVPFYSILLAALTWGHQAFWPIVIAQSLLGAGTVLGAAFLARQMFAGPQGQIASVLAAAVTAVYPYYVVHDTALQETSLFTLLTLCAVLAAQRVACAGGLWLAALCGLLLGLDVLTRSPIALFALLVPIWLFLRKRVVPGLLCALLLGLTVFPWIYRNDKVTGAPLLTTESGFELWNGNNPLLFRYYPLQSVDVSIDANIKALSPKEQQEIWALGNNPAIVDRWFRNTALAYMRAHPWLTLCNDLRKIGATFDWLPTPRRSLVETLAHAFSFGPVMLLGLYGMFLRRARWREDSLIYLLFAQFILVTAIYFGQTNHRVFLDVYWIVFAAGALAAALERRTARRAGNATASA